MVKGNLLSTRAKFLSHNHENIYVGKEPISAGLQMALVNCMDNLPLSCASITDKLTGKLNKRLKGKFIRIASKNDVVDLEFGISGQHGRTGAGKKPDYDYSEADLIDNKNKPQHLVKALKKEDAIFYIAGKL